MNEKQFDAVPWITQEPLDATVSVINTPSIKVAIGLMTDISTTGIRYINNLPFTPMYLEVHALFSSYSMSVMSWGASAPSSGYSCVYQHRNSGDVLGSALMDGRIFFLTYNGQIAEGVVYSWGNNSVGIRVTSCTTPCQLQWRVWGK